MRRLRDFYRPVRQEMQPTDVHAVLRGVLDLTSKQLQHAKITVEQEQAYGLPLIQATPDHLKQVFLNLVLNAIDAMSGAGPVGRHVVRPHGSRPDANGRQPLAPGRAH